MPEYAHLPLPFTAEQWPECGLEVLRDLVGAERLIVADDGTLYVFVPGGHPVRVQDGWWVLRYGDGTLSVASENQRKRWRFLLDG